MRRAAALGALLARSAGAQPQALTAAGWPAAGAQLQHAAGFAAGGTPPPIVPNPLQQIVPPIIKGVRAAVDGLSSGAAALSEGLRDGPATRSAIAYFADNVLLSGTFVPPDSLDVAKWAAFLAAHGYSSKEGWDTLMGVIKAQASSFNPSQVEALVPALHAVGRYDKGLWDTLAGIVKARFPEFETPGLARLVPAYAARDHFDAALWDDAADAITYCNHYLAASVIPLADVAGLFAAYARFEVDRGDLFVSLGRTIHEDRLKALSDDEAREVVPSLLRSFKALAFYPDCTEALLLVGRLKPGLFGPADNAVAAEVEAELRGMSPDGQLPWLDGGYKDPAHFHGGAFGSYNLWVAREELVPTHYRPSDISPRPASMSLTPPTPAAEPAAASS